MDVNPPFSDQEKRFVLAEAIKTSSLPLDKILQVFSDGSVQPDWNQMLLPYGRNVASCKKAFDAIRPRQHPLPQQNFQTQNYQLMPSIHHSQQQQPQKQNKRKPPPDSLETSTAKRRISDGPQHPNLLPRPAIGSPGQSSSSVAPMKKRGRPSKAAVAQRDADAIARGEVIAPARTSSLRPDTPNAGERTGTPTYQNIAPMMLSPRPPMPSPITPAGYGVQSFDGSEAGSPGKKIQPLPRSLAKEGQTSFPILNPDASSSRSERSTYPSIISHLTDTIPSSYITSASATQASSHPRQILHPPVSSYGQSSTSPSSTSIPPQKGSNEGHS